MGLKDVLTGIAIAGIVVFLMLGFAEFSAIDNGVNETLLDSPILAGLNDTLLGNLSSLHTDSNSSLDKFSKDEPDSKSESGFGLLSVFPMIIKFIGTTIVLFTALVTFPLNALQLPEVLINIIVGLLVVTMLFLGWRVIKAGS